MSRTAVVIFIFLGIVAVALAFGNPASTSWPLKCPLFWFTGLQCPLCGMQRMVHELLHLHIASAWHYNKILLVTLPYWCVMCAGQLVPRWQKSSGIIKFCYRNSTIFLMLGVMVAWGILRNC